MGKKEPILEHTDFLGQFSNLFCGAKKIDTLQETIIVAQYNLEWYGFNTIFLNHFELTIHTKWNST